MPRILSVSTVLPPHEVKQAEAVELTRSLFSRKFKDIERLLNVFQNGDIEKRDVCMPLEWYGQEHDFEERNDLYIHHAIDFGVKAVQACLQQSETLAETVAPSEIDAIFFISSTGIATPSIEARIMNRLPFRDDVKRVPIWGLGCAGGACRSQQGFRILQSLSKGECTSSVHRALQFDVPKRRLFKKQPCRSIIVFRRRCVCAHCWRSI